MENGAHGHPLRRCQRRGHRGPEKAVQARARAPDSPLYPADLHRPRPLPRRPGDGCNTNAQVMAWILDEYSSRHGYTPAAVTGKPVSLGGSLGREEATGRGIMYVMMEYSRDFGIPLKGSRVVIQGFGNVGGHLARLLAAEAGAKVVAVSDVNGGIVNEHGLDVAALLAHTAVRKPVSEFADGQAI